MQSFTYVFLRNSKALKTLCDVALSGHIPCRPLLLQCYASYGHTHRVPFSNTVNIQDIEDRGKEFVSAQMHT